jgi:hypothetical protein
MYKHTNQFRCGCASRAAFLIAGVAATAALAQGPRVVNEADYADRLRAMWLGECIANWTGLQTEGHRPAAPFLTDADWQQYWFGVPLDFRLDFNPWRADDDTDIEYIYLHLMSSLGHARLTPNEIAAGWTDHINRFIWVSNAFARDLIGRGVVPPSTSLASSNVNRLMIDAQLTTEFFGALAPGMPERALDLADLPIRTTASGYALHASQFYMVLYSLALQVPQTLSAREKAIWLFQHARAFIPDTSKSADIADFVYADFIANPDSYNWERTRDLVAQRYQSNAAANGFRYRAWYESSVNFAGGCIALLYGECDYRKSVRIGTLSGWDSDNCTATLGGMVGLMLGYQELTAQFPGVTFSDRFDIYRTRDNLPDYLPADAAAQDTLTLMAQRMIPIARQVVIDAGGVVDSAGGRWLLPPVSTGPRLAFNPEFREDQRSGNNAVLRAGGTVTPSNNFGASNPGSGRGSNWIHYIANGIETSFAGREEDEDERYWYTTQGGGVAPGADIVLSVVYDRPVEVAAVRFIEGDHFTDAHPPSGGWFTSVAVETLVGGAWVAQAVTPSESPDPARPFQIIDYVLAAPVQATGIRLRGPGGGTGAFTTCSELDALASAPPVPAYGSFDLNHDDVLSIEDLHAWWASPSDLDGDGVADAADRQYLERAIRWNERSDMLAGR